MRIGLAQMLMESDMEINFNKGLDFMRKASRQPVCIRDAVTMQGKVFSGESVVSDCNGSILRLIFQVPQRLEKNLYTSL